MAAVTDVLLTRPQVGIAGPGCAATNAEFEFLLACCKAEHKKPDAAEACTVPVNWPRALQLAERHRVLPALLAYEAPASAEFQLALTAAKRKHFRTALRFCAELRSILDKFESHGIEVLPHKGPVLSYALFGDATLRQFGDLDFVIRPRDIPHARVALEELGYWADLQLSARQEKAYLRAGYEYVFGCDAGKHLVEVQWQILPHFYSIGFDMESLFSRAIEINFEGQGARMLGNEDLMLILCVHAAKHQWQDLGMIRDIAALVRRRPDWGRIEREARRLGMFRILLVSLLLARNLLECKLPLHSAAEKEIRYCEDLATALELNLRTGRQADTDSLAYFFSMLKLRERRRDRLRFAWRLAATPNLGEWESIVIPDRLFSLYRGVRAVRLTRRLCGF